MIRLFDIFLSGVAIVGLLPVCLPICLLLRLTGEGEVFYKQERVGINGKKFHLLKFATMLKDSPNMSTGTITVANDPRILPMGSILRKTKINELPQLINILIGQMSIIGPRPLTSETFEAYPSEVKTAITSVKPGLSGIGSIIFRNEEKLMNGRNANIDFYTDVIAPYKGELEKWYVNNASVRIYFLLIILTIVAIIKPNSYIYRKCLPTLPAAPSSLKNLL